MTPLARPARRRLTPGAVVAATALVLGAGGVASAAIPAADGTITALLPQERRHVARHRRRGRPDVQVERNPELSAMVVRMPARSRACFR